MTSHGAKLPRKKEDAIAALLLRPRIEEDARSINISPKALRRWMQLPEFAAEYLQARRDVVLQANARIQQNSGAAVVLLTARADASAR